jgi:ubiquinone/menaquinone biosynthesis C-methylase UbiE
MTPVTSLSAGAVEASPGLTAWESAYRRFETPEQEVRKFMRRLRVMGVSSIGKDRKIVELFCGRGNGLVALSNLGFVQIEGVDLSAALLSQYSGVARCHVADCRNLPFDDHSREVIIIQGGLHHLHSASGDLDRCLREIRRVLTVDGRLLIVEPWLTPFLSFVHAVCRQTWIRGLVPKIDALATMIDHERETYFEWLSRPTEILVALDRYFLAENLRCSWGKLMFLGTPRCDAALRDGGAFHAR